MANFDAITHRTVKVNGIDMHVAEIGDKEAPIIVFVHGFPELWYSWRHQMVSLSALGYHAVAPDMRGYGDTYAPPDARSYTYGHIVGDLVALLDELGAQQVFVVGHDWGAMIAWWLCLFRPDRVKALVNMSVAFLPRDPNIKPVDMFRAAYGDDYYICRFQDYGGDGIDYSGYFIAPEDFPSKEAAICWAKEKARALGFFLVIASYKPERRDGRTQCQLKCDRHKRKDERNFDHAQRLNTRRKATGCKFMVKAIQRLVGSDWYIAVKSGVTGKHNHELAVYPEGHRQSSGLSPGAKKLVRQMTDAQTKPCNILAAVKQKFPEDNPNARHIYNCRDQYRRETSDGRNPAQQLLHQAIQHQYIHWILTDESDAVTHVFLAHPTSAALLRTYPYVISMDSTYKTNRYKYPLVEMIGMTPCNQNFLVAWALVQDKTEFSYRWVLQSLRYLLGDNIHPTVIVTDKEMGLLAPIRDIFPSSAHLLCLWHINKDVEHHVGKLYGGNKSAGEKFKNGVWKRVVDATSLEEFQREVQLLRDAHRFRGVITTYVEKTWLAHKEKFVRYWTNQVLHFGNTSNCRVESAHASLKEWIESSRTALDTLFVRINKSIEMQQTQLRHCLEESRRHKITTQ